MSCKRTVFVKLRGDAPMQIVSGLLQRPNVRFEAPPRAVIDTELNQFIGWFNSSQQSDIDPIVRAGIAHLWFVTMYATLHRKPKGLFKKRLQLHIARSFLVGHKTFSTGLNEAPKR